MDPYTPTSGILFVFWLICAIGGLLAYMAPTILAVIRKEASAPGIFLVNFFLGWTGIGWLIALLWALGHFAGRRRMGRAEGHVR